jgi:hypothetical protein
MSRVLDIVVVLSFRPTPHRICLSTSFQTSSSLDKAKRPLHLRSQRRDGRIGSHLLSSLGDRSDGREGL